MCTHVLHTSAQALLCAIHDMVTFLLNEIYYYVMLRYVILCYVCCVILCYIILYYIILYYIILIQLWHSALCINSIQISDKVIHSL
jgi:hypothetical protein